MLRTIKELISKIDNHVDMLDDLTGYVERFIDAMKKQSGYFK